jgi:sugar (pentulose or hexulose) kinase
LNHFLCQMIADATGRTVIAGPSEATAFGSVMAQAIATGHLPNLAAAAEVMKASLECHSYEPGPPEQWNEAYTRFVSVTSGNRTAQPSNA